MDEKEIIAIAEILCDAYYEHGEKFINKSIELALRVIAKNSYQEYSYGSYSFSALNGRKATVDELNQHRKYNDENYGSYLIHDIVNRFRQYSAPIEFEESKSNEKIEHISEINSISKFY